MSKSTSDNSFSESSQDNDEFFVVGVGASAGGLRALEEFFESMPIDSGAAFITIQHLSPDFKSLMKELLGRCTQMNIYKVHDGMELQPNSIYLIPPGNNLVIEEEKLRLKKQEERIHHRPNFPIDIFFKSLAENYRERAIGVILSGTGSDGTQGLQDIQEVGGITLVQEPTTAEFDGMPRSAIATGVINRVLSPQDLAETIYQFLQSPTSPEEFTQQQVISANDPELQRITSLLARHEQIDFSQYKSNTLNRRIHRRCLITGSTTVKEYINLLESCPGEREVLRGDLLIGVTGFFRDRLVWEFLEKNIINNLVEQGKSGEELRFWITACSTGEEAYSLAILVDEAISKSHKQITVKIFATDVDCQALEKATQGIYPDTIASEITQERLQTYFTDKGENFQVKRKLREMVIFAPHNLIKDAGFTRIHLITCRNVLIYMQPQLQQQVLRNLHFALTLKGTLFLGESETVGDFKDEFLPLHKTWKIYQKKRDVRLSWPLRGAEQLGSSITCPYSSERKANRSKKEQVLESALSLILGQQKTTCLLVDSNNQVLYLFEDLANVLKLPTGELSKDITKLVVPALQLPLNTALRRAKQEKRPILYTGIKLDKTNDSRRVNLKVSYQEENKLAGDFLTVIITEDNQSPPSKVTGESFEAGTEASQRIAELEEELQHTRENLQAVIEELEATNEEQQSTNEELIASNEELQSTNEELQSVNEELYSVNSEYQSKIQELTQLNDDVDNLLRSTDIGVVFLDKELKIRKFTPAATEAINLVAADISRPLKHLSHNLDCHNLLELLQRVVETDKPLAKEVKLIEANINFLVRIHPYRQNEGFSDGVVVTFVDIDDIKKAEEALKKAEEDLIQANESLERRVEERAAALQESEERFRATFEQAAVGIAHVSPQGKWLNVNQRICNIVGYTQEEIYQLNFQDVIHPDDLDADLAYAQQLLAGEIDSYAMEKRYIHKNGSDVWINLTRSLVRTETGEPKYFIGVAEDISERRQIQQELEQAEERFRATFEKAALGIAHVSPEGRWLRVNQKICDIFGYTPEELQKLTFQDITHPDDLDPGLVYIEQLLAGEIDSYSMEKRYIRKNGLPVWINLAVSLVRTETGEANYFISLLEDISERKLFQEQLRRINENLELVNENLESRVEERTAAIKQVNQQLRQEIQERKQAKEALHKANAKLEQRVRERTVELEAAKDKAEAADRAKSAFIAHMSHELRTPLNGILGFAQILKRDSTLTSKQFNGIDIIQKSGSHLLTLIEDILCIAKIEAGKLELHTNEFHFPSFLHNLIALIRVRAEEKSIAFNYQAVSSLPKTLQCDETRLRQILLNLLSNAIKFTSTGGVVFKVGYLTSFESDAVTTNANIVIRFYIEDTGPGIPPEKLAEIFLPFQQITDSTIPNNGTGLGLTISQNIARQMGGEIKVRSNPSKGSTFWFDLEVPQARANHTNDRSEEPWEETLAPKKMKGYEGQKYKILIADDQANNRAVLVNLLSPLGFEVLEAGNGIEALAKAKEFQPDLILLDLVMPVLDGFEVARRLQQEPTLQDKKVFAISASALPKDESSSYQAGCHAFLPKPVNFEQLLKLIQTHLQLEWSYDEYIARAAAPEKREKSSQIISPEQEIVNLLFNFAKRGDIGSLLEEATCLEAQDQKFIPFIQEIRQLAQSFQLQDLQRFLKEYME